MRQCSRRDFLAGGLVGSAVAAGLAQGAFAGDSLTAQVDAIAREALGAGASPGLQVAIWKGGQPLLSRAYGVAHISTNTPLTERSIFRVGSLTKQFTAAAIIKLAAGGKLDLQDNVATYLPFMSSLKALTLLELMHHTAGLHSDETEAPSTSGTHAPNTQIDLAKEIAGQKVPFDFDPGTAWLYSNANYIVLGAVIEAVTNTSFEQALSDHVFKPMRLVSTAVDHTQRPATAQVRGYSATESEKPVFVEAPFVKIEEAGGAGAMRSSASDLCSWHAQLLSGQFFSDEHLRLMTAPGTLRDGRISGANRFRAEDANYGETQYACGLLVSPPSDPQPNLLHYGFINGFAAMLQTWTRPAVTLAVLCNADAGPAAPFRSLRKAVSRIVL